MTQIAAWRCAELARASSVAIEPAWSFDLRYFVGRTLPDWQSNPAAVATPFPGVPAARLVLGHTRCSCPDSREFGNRRSQECGPQPCREKSGRGKRREQFWWFLAGIVPATRWIEYRDGSWVHPEAVTPTVRAATLQGRGGFFHRPKGDCLA